MLSSIKLCKVTFLKRKLFFVILTSYFFILTSHASALSLSYPACSPAIKSEIEAKLKEKIFETLNVTECVATEEGYAFRFRETDLVSASDTHYELHRAGEATLDRATFIITNGVSRSGLVSLLNLIESQPVYTTIVSSIQNSFRYVNASAGILIGIESRPSKPNLYFAATKPTSIKPIKETSSGTDTSFATISTSNLSLSFAPLSLTGFQTVVSNPPSAPLPLPTPSPTPSINSGQATPPSTNRISNPAFALCDPSTLRAVSFGERNSAVTNLQNCLIGLSYAIPAGATGYYGNQTVIALKRFYLEQASYTWHGLKLGPLGIETFQRIGMTAR